MCGVFQRAAGPGVVERWRAALARQRLPAAHVAWCDAAAAADLVGVKPAGAGLWWPAGTVASPARSVAALLDHPRVSLVQAAAAVVDGVGGGWTAAATDGRPLARAAVAVIAAGADSPRLLQATALPVRAVAGQVTFIDSGPLRALRAALGGDGTLLRAPDGTIAVGATYEPLGAAGGGALDVRRAAHSNLARLDRLLATPVDARVVGHFAGVRCVARDRLPYAGAVADEAIGAASAARLRGAHLDDLSRRPRLLAAFALGSRGLTFGALAGELIAAQVEGEPLPLERDLVDTLDPARALLRRLRTGRAAAG
jgi:tRNA 5-methylaminomethyl-2-thiouridine biosynthesis bifunctional protein